MKYAKTAFFLSILTFFGCESTPEIYVVRPWEGHFYNTNDFLKATEGLVLRENESIWVLSNKTLRKTLENAK